MKRAFLTLALVAAAAVGVMAWSVADQVWFMRPAPDAAARSVTIAPDMTATSIRMELIGAGIMDGGAPFIAYVKATGAAARLKAGTFVLKPGMAVADIVRTLTEATASERRITLLEGWGIREMGEYLVAQGALTDIDAWYAAVGTPPSALGGTRQIPGTDFRGEFAILAALPSGATLEGYLFPDTYRIAVDASAEDIVRTLLGNFARRTADLPSVTYDQLRLASVVEREVRSDADRKMVADLFLRRMEEGMALQADSTVNYVTGKKTPALSAADRDLDTPWNTYRHRGLPPTPISNPSLSSIRAVLDPTPNLSVYFLTDADGRVHYARTLEEHVANKRRYLP